MTTKIYQTYKDFLDRENKDENGVSRTFADIHPTWEAMNTTNKSCWNCSDCSNCFHCFHCSYCSNCFHCFHCFHCSDCSDCSHCSDCSTCFDRTDDFTIPVIPNIHQAVLEAVTKTPDALNMCTWHTCNTTHCRAGWVVTLAGKEGAELERKTSTPFAAFQIYRVSSSIKVPFSRFYETDEEAMADIERCAKEEKLSNLNLNK